MINLNKNKLKQGDNNYSLEICSFIHFHLDEVMNNERRKPLALVIILLFIGGVWKVCLYRTIQIISSGECCVPPHKISHHHIQVF